MNESSYDSPQSEVDNKLQKKGVMESAILNFMKAWNGKASFSSAFFGYFILGNKAFKPYLNPNIVRIMYIMLNHLMIVGTAFLI